MVKKSFLTCLVLTSIHSGFIGAIAARPIFKADKIPVEVVKSSDLMFVNTRSCEESLNSVLGAREFFLFKEWEQRAMS